MAQTTISLVIEQEGPAIFQYRASEKDGLRTQFDELSVTWAPQSVVEQPPGTAGASETLAMVVFASASIVFLMRKFFDTLAGEAGKDAYAAIKKLIVKMAARNRSKTYHLQQSIYLVAEVGDQHVIVPFSLTDDLYDDLVHKLRTNSATQDEKADAMALLERDSEQQLDQALRTIAEAWPRIEADILEFEVGKIGSIGESANGLHVLERVEAATGPRWAICAVSKSNDWHLPQRFRARPDRGF